jgi:beta-lactamase regulating signal transducer with metallopeptidase domain
MAWLTLSDVAVAVELVLRATLLIAVAWLSATALRKAGASAAARHLAWLLCIAALLALPILWWLGPALRLPILPAEAATAVAAAPPTAVSAEAAAGAVTSLPAGSPDEWRWGAALLATYILGAAALLLRLVAGRRMLARWWRDAAPVDDVAWETLLSELCSEMLLSRRVELRIAPGPVVPMTWGTLAPRLLLPAQALGWSPERRRLVLLHELAHVVRCDSLSRSIASLVCALYWFHPGAWLAARQMRIEQECAADDRVLTAGGSAQAYARSLLHLAQAIGERSRPDLAATMAGTCQLERRLVSITTPARRDRPGRFFLSSSAAFASLGTLVVAAGVPVSPSSAIPARLSARSLPVAARAGAERVAATEAVAPLDVTRGRVAPATHRNAAASDGAAAQPRQARQSDDGIARERSAGKPQAPAAAPPLYDYGWQLPQRDLTVPAGSLAAPRQAGRLAVPAPLYASNERTGRPRWAQIAPRLLLPDKPSLLHPTTARTTPMLSWSIETGPH